MIPAWITARSARLLAALLLLLAVFAGGAWTGQRWERGAQAIAQTSAAIEADGRARIVAQQDLNAARTAAADRTRLESRARDLSLRIAHAAQTPPPADCRLPVVDRWLLNSAIDAANGTDTPERLPVKVPKPPAP